MTRTSKGEEKRTSCWDFDKISGASCWMVVSKGPANLPMLPAQWENIQFKSPRSFPAVSLSRCLRSNAWSSRPIILDVVWSFGWNLIVPDKANSAVWTDVPRKWRSKDASKALLSWGGAPINLKQWRKPSCDTLLWWMNSTPNSSSKYAAQKARHVLRAIATPSWGKRLKLTTADSNPYAKPYRGVKRHPSLGMNTATELKRRWSWQTGRPR